MTCGYSEKKDIKITDYLNKPGQISDWENLMAQIRSGGFTTINVASDKRRELMCAVDDFILAHDD